MKACLKGVSKRRRSGWGMEKCCTVDNLDFSALIFLPISIIGFGFICMHMT